MNGTELRSLLKPNDVVTVFNNEGEWEFVDFSPHDPNIIILRSLSSGFEGKFAMFSNGQQRVFPVHVEETVVIQPTAIAVEPELEQENITFVTSSQAKVFEEKPKPMKNKRGRPKKRKNEED